MKTGGLEKLPINSRGLVRIDPDSLDANMLRAVLDYDPLTGIFTWKVQRGGTAKPGSRAGSPDRDGYILIQLGDRNFKAHRLAWLYVYGEWPDGDVDHTHGRTGDNRISELRVLTHSQNLVNAKLASHNKSGVTGVYWDRSRNKWVAQIQTEGRARYLGRYSSKERAEAVRLEAALRHVGGHIRAENRRVF